MRYRIEFLKEAAEDQSVCLARSLRAPDIDVVQLQALAWSASAQRNFGAAGFQILDEAERVVAIEAFDGPAPAIH